MGKNMKLVTFDVHMPKEHQASLVGGKFLKATSEDIVLVRCRYYIAPEHYGSF